MSRSGDKGLSFSKIVVGTFGRRICIGEVEEAPVGGRSQVMKWCGGLRAPGSGKSGLVSVPPGGSECGFTSLRLSFLGCKFVPCLGRWS